MGGALAPPPSYATVYNCIVFQLLPNAEILRVMAMFGVCLERNDAFVAKNSRCLNYLFHITVPSD